MCNRKYELERASATIHGIPTFVVWITNVVQEHQLAGGTFYDQNVVVLSFPPSIKTCSYKIIKAYGSHFHVDDSTSIGCVTYDNRVSSFFSHNNVDDNHHPSRQLQYVGVLKGAKSLRCVKILSQCHLFVFCLPNIFLPCKDTFMDDYDGILNFNNLKYNPKFFDSNLFIIFYGDQNIG
jgi:hypothetical protein